MPMKGSTLNSRSLEGKGVRIMGGHLSLISNFDGTLLQVIVSSNIFLTLPENVFIVGTSMRKPK